MRIIIVLLTVLTFAGCKAGKISTTADSKETETIIFGRLKIESANPMPYSKIVMHFNERMWGKYVVRPDDSGYFYIKVPIGKNQIALLEYLDGSGYFKNIAKDYITVDVAAPDKVHYVGDLTFSWTPDKYDRRGSGGAAGAMAEAKGKEFRIPVSVQGSAATVAYFRRKFPDNKKEIVNQLMSVGN